jgi:glycosyltransferase involved in cell wall biosynthesis
MKVLYITPHLSTGGAPRYLLKKIEELKDDCDIYCVEYSNISDDFIVQKDQIKAILGRKLITLGQDKSVLLALIDKISPDIVHFEEIPEYFCDHKIASAIYRKTRNYKIFETSHDSSFDVSKKIFFPDKFLFVSIFQQRRFSELGVDSEVIEFPIEKKKKENREASLIRLGLDPQKTHILNIGLFTPRKNQSEIVDYARKMTDFPVQFHFVGNTADNYKYYWEPILKDLPLNCKVWGERSDVDRFYNAMDLFLFTSKGTESDKETSPLVIRESIGWGIPALIYNLDVYCGIYDAYPNIKFLGDSFQENLSLIKSFITTADSEVPPNSLETSEYAFVISTYPNTKLLEELTLDCIRELKKFGADIILASHCPLSKELQENVDYCVFDKKNILTKHDFYSYHWFNNDEFHCTFNINQNKKLYHGAAVYTNYHNGVSLANKLGYEKVICLNFDYLLKDENCLERLFLKMQDAKGYFIKDSFADGDVLRTAFFVIDSNFFCNRFARVTSAEQYMALKGDLEFSGSLERIYHHILKDDLNQFSLVSPSDFYDLDLAGCECDIMSEIELAGLLPVEGKSNQICFFYRSVSKKNDKKLVIVCPEGRTEKEISGPLCFFKLIDSSRLPICVEFWTEDREQKRSVHEKILVDETYIKNTITENGLFRQK